MLILFFAQSTPVLAETWIEVAYWREDGKRYVRWIDAMSIVERGNWIYANMKLKSDVGGSVQPIKINCKKGIFGYAGLSSLGLEFAGMSSLEFFREKNGYWIADYEIGTEDKATKSPGKEGTYNFLCKESKVGFKFPFINNLISN